MRYALIIKNCKTLEDKALKIFKNKSKKSKKYILACEEKNYFPKLEIYYLLIKNGFDYNWLDLDAENIFCKNDKIGYYSSKPSYFSQKFLRNLQKFYSNKIILRMIKEFDFQMYRVEVKHSIRSLDLISKDKKVSQMLRKKNIKSFTYLHKHLYRLSIFLEKEDFNLNQNKKVLSLNNNVVNSQKGKISIKVPKTKHELIKVSEDFDFCIGTEDSYGENIRLGKYSFISVYLNNNPYQGILFDNERIIECFNRSNHSADFEVKQLIREKIFNSRKIEAKSSWIDYFLYEKGILTLVTKKNSKYQYEVPEEVVNNLENHHSRGAYYSNYIKGNFPSLRN